jgi:hypothetical protein
MTGVWIVLAVVVVAVIARTIGWSRGDTARSDLGSVSHQWVAEHRLSQPQEPHR